MNLSEIKKKDLLTAAIFLLSFLIVFGQSLFYPFVTLDDSLLVYLNPLVQEFSWKNIYAIFTSYDPELYIPLTLLSYKLDFLAGGLNPFFYHLQNLLWHFLNSFLVSVLLFKLLKSKLIAVILGLIFLLHPLNVETAVWISARKDLLASFFALISLISYLQFKETNQKRLFLVGLICFLLGLMAKVSVVLLPLVLIGFDLWENRKNLSSLVVNKIPFLVISAIFVIIALHGKSASLEVSLADRIFLAVKSFWFYLPKFIWPVGLSVVYPDFGEISLLSVDFLIPFGLLILLFVLVFFSLRRSNSFLLAVLIYTAFLLPSFFNLSKGDVNYLASDRYVYLAMVGLLFLVGLFFKRMIQYRAAIICSIFIILLFGVFTFRQVRIWSDGEALARQAIKYYPESSLAHLMLGNYLSAKGDDSQALAEFYKAIEISNNPTAYFNAALIYEKMGEAGNAKKMYRQAIEKRPNYALARTNLAALYFRENDLKKAKEQLEEAIKYAPEYAYAHFNLGLVLSSEKDFSQAAGHFLLARDDPSLSVKARVGLIKSLLAQMKAEEAVKQLKDALEKHPQESSLLELVELMKNFGVIE